MLPCSVRRVAVAATAPQSPLLSALPRGAAATVTRTYTPAQRRRYSSSKPSRDNGSEDPSVRQSVQPATETNKTTEAKTSGEKRKRKAKEAPEKLKYPSVPTTAHIPSDFLALSSFFSLHRPISVTRGLPRNVTDDAFASIFAPPTRGQKAAEVMTTISRTVDELEQPMAGLSMQQQQQGDEAAEPHRHDGGLQKIDLRNADGSEMSITVQVNNMSGQFLPFRPPPLPQPESAKAAADALENALDEQGQQDAQTRVYKAVFTIEETTDASGQVKIVAHSPELIEEPSDEHEASSEPAPAAEPRRFLERMALRQLRYEEARRQRETMLAISVRRQRKLKMKKKKYKKLTKRLRHERLKHGRT